MKQDFIYINPKEINDIDFKIKYPECSCPWYVHWIPFYKKKYKTVKICPVTQIEMDMEVVMVSLKLFPNQTNTDEIIKVLCELRNEFENVKCTCG